MASGNTPVLGQQTMANSTSVAIASDQTPLQIHSDSLNTITGSPEKPQYTTLVGDPDGDFNGVNILEALLDTNQTLSLPVRVINPPKQDPSGAAIPSDSAGPFNWFSSTASMPVVIDTTGYQTIVLQQVGAGAVTPTVSNDGINYLSTVCLSTGIASLLAAATSGAGVFVLPVTGRYLKLTGPASAVQGIIYLRQTPFSAYVGTSATTPFNLSQIAATATVTAGVAGLIAVGGNIASGVAPTANPVLIAGRDVTISNSGVITNLTRTLLTDTSGRLQTIINGVDSGNVQRQVGVRLNPDLGIAAQPVFDASTVDGQTLLELITQSIFEQRMTNLYLYNLSRNINRGQDETDAPDVLRADPSMFNLT